MIDEWATAGTVAAIHQDMGQVIGVGQQGEFLRLITPLHGEVHQIGACLPQFLSPHRRIPICVITRGKSDRIDPSDVCAQELPDLAE